MNLNQFVPSEVCLQCDGCCRFKEENSSWRPKMAKEEIAQLKLRYSEEHSDEVLRLAQDGSKDGERSRTKSKQKEILPPLLRKQRGQNDEKISLAGLILSKETFSNEGSIKTISCHGEYLCSFFNPSDHTCRIYPTRPFECQLYPFVLTRQNQKSVICVHLMCPFIQQKRATRDFDDYVAYLKNFFQETEVLAFLRRNPDLVGDYSDYQAELEYLFDLPSDCTL